jgi:hypothetical protein
MNAKGNGVKYAQPTGADDWQIEADLRCLQEAEAIQKDEKRFKRAQELAKRKLLELASIASETE